MRIAITNWSNRMVGGAEQYIAAMGEYLPARGHEVALWHETHEPADRRALPLGREMNQWDVSELGVERALEALRRWRPDIIYCQGMRDESLHAVTAAIAPSVFFAHNHHGLCISGSRSHMFPVARPCDKRFGPECLAHYLPRRCGGLNPFTMLEEYGRNRGRLRALGDYSMVITHSHTVTEEYLRQGIECKRVSYYAGSGAPAPGRPWSAAKELRLLMLGRMMATKGGQVLIGCLPRVATRLNRPVSLTLAGDGPCLGDWQRRAERVAGVSARHPEIRIAFPGWVSGERRLELLSETDLLVMPSVWPEPYGMVGSEAALSGVPTVAFRVGGIPEWLFDGVNGTLAPGDPPTAAGLVDAIERAAGDERVYLSLRERALAAALGSTLDVHYRDLMDVFDGLRGFRGGPGSAEENVAREVAS